MFKINLTKVVTFDFLAPLFFAPQRLLEFCSKVKVKWYICISECTNSFKLAAVLNHAIPQSQKIENCITWNMKSTISMFRVSSLRTRWPLHLRLCGWIHFPLQPMTSSPASLLPSTLETTNYARLWRFLVDVGSPVLRDTFDTIHPPVELQSVLRHHAEHAALQSL